MSLPLKNPVLIIPNNGKIIEKRANYLERQFMKNKKFFEDYKKFMNDILQKSYARLAFEIQPHHGIYHPSKPGKLRVGFDCSVEFNGRSINTELLSGPDLTN